VSFSSRSFDQLWFEQDARDLAEHTGGQTFLYRYAHEALDAIERGSRVRYLLGYYPARSTWDGSYRKVEIRVKQPGAVLFYRHGYHAASEIAPLDYGEVLAHARIMAAARSLRPPRDVAMTGVARVETATEEGTQVQVDLEVQMSEVVFATEADRRIASLDIAIFVADKDQNLIGELWQQIDVKRGHDRPSQHPLIHRAVVHSRGAPRYVKVVVYDPAGDRLGVVVIDLRRK
jgi:hypothetical protein